MKIHYWISLVMLAIFFLLVMSTQACDLAPLHPWNEFLDSPISQSVIVSREAVRWTEITPLKEHIQSGRLSESTLFKALFQYGSISQSTFEQIRQRNIEQFYLITGQNSERPYLYLSIQELKARGISPIGNPLGYRSRGHRGIEVVAQKFRIENQAQKQALLSYMQQMKRPGYISLSMSMHPELTGFIKLIEQLGHIDILRWQDIHRTLEDLEAPAIITPVPTNQNASNSPTFYLMKDVEDETF